MDRKLFDKFCENQNIVGIVKATFYEWLNKKYPKGISDRVSLQREWAEFYRESTSKA